MAKEKKKSIKTKAANGIRTADVANSSIRNILTELSESISGKVTNDDLWDSLSFFGGKCPYTGEDMLSRIENNEGGYALDHIVPINREFCGLNVKGNLVIVDKTANGKKGSKEIEDFLMNDESIDADEKTRKERIKRIRDYQKKCGYDPDAMKIVLQPRLREIYSEIQEQQKRYVDDIKNELINTLDLDLQLETKQNDYKEYESRKPAEVVKEVLIPLLEKGNATPSEVKKYMTVEESKKDFALAGFSLLIEDPAPEIKKRYYAHPIVIRGKEYYICSQWYKNNIGPVIEWIKKHE